MLGQPILYVPLSGSRVLSVAAPCQVARRFAATRRAAAQRLTRVRGVRVYQVSNSTALLRAHRRLLVRERTGGAAVPRTVFLLGLTSLFTDISSEMVVTILPLYLVYVGGFTPLAFGVIDGIYNGAAALVGLGQRLRRRPLPAPQGGRDGRATASRPCASSCSPPSARRCRPSARRC